jgi:CHAD domain-containing protein
MHDDETPLPEPATESALASRFLAEAVRSRALEINTETRKRISAKKAFEHESVHQIRVSSKILRALWQLVRPVIEPQIARNANERLRELAHSLAGARDAEVMANLMAELREADEPLYRASFDRAAKLFVEPDDLADHAAELRPAMLAAIDGDRDDWRQLVLPDDHSLIEHGLGRTYRKTRRRAETAGRTKVHPDLHRWRRWVKYLRYQLESLFELPPSGIAERVEDLKALGTVLGQRNDLAVLRGRLKELGGGDTFGAVFRSIDLRDQALATRIPEVSARLFDHTPEGFVAVVKSDIGGYEPAE